MSYNTIEVTSPGRLPLLAGETASQSRHVGSLELRIPATMSGPKRKENGRGDLWVTDQRVVFIGINPPVQRSCSSATYDVTPSFLSLAIPYTTLLKCTYYLPTFGANHLLISFLPDPDLGEGSNLPNPGRGANLEAKITLEDGTGHAVWQAIEAYKAKSEERRLQAEVLPAYQAQADGVIKI